VRQPGDEPTAAAVEDHPRRPLGLFEGHGIEIEYMIVDRGSLAVRPLCDEVIRAACGQIESEIEVGPLCWSNELCLHVIELKTNGPVARLAGAERHFLEHVRRIDALLEPMGAMLLPGGMHPFMDPATDTVLWPHEYSEVYDTYNRIFGCQGHGWANLQSVHLNLPFHGDEEFGRLHAAIRVLLPLLPALAASSPMMDGRLTGVADTRLEVYRTNQKRVPILTGHVIPEPVFTKADYEGELLAGLYRAVASLDPEGVLQHEWINSRGAIARFDRDAIEIRVLDVQETPAADLAVLTAVTHALRGLADGDGEAQRRWGVEPLARLFQDVVREGDRAVIRDREYLALLGLHASSATAGEVWQHLVHPWPMMPPAVDAALRHLLDNGCLSGRLARALGAEPRRDRVRAVYADLAACLRSGHLFG
jgi:gamma-glutamyl:cysteine ligase YbdK (ATP-grasp superfamily)